VEFEDSESRCRLGVREIESVDEWKVIVARLLRGGQGSGLCFLEDVVFWHFLLGCEMFW